STLAGLTTQAEKPKGDGPGKNSGSLGNITEWLVLGPLPYDPETSRKELLDKEFIPGEASLRPDLGEKTAGSEWCKVPSTGSLLNLNLHYEDRSAKVFYAHAWLHAKDGGRLRLRLMGPTCRFRFNGEDVLSLDEKTLHHMDREVELKKGWNSLLVKVFTTQRKDNWAYPHYNSPPDSGYFQVVMWGRTDGETYQEKNILWSAPLPQAVRFSCAQPLVIGDRVIVNADPSFVICYDKMTGRRLWIDYCGHHEFVTDAERQAHPELFEQIDPKAKRIKEIASSWTGALAEDVEMTGLVGDVARLLKDVDGKKYMGAIPRQEAGWAGLTSCTDGRFVYTWFTNGVVVCHDLDGKRRWMVLDNQERRREVQVSHGYHVSPILTDTEFVVPTNETTAYDRQTGRTLWKMPTKVYGWPPVNPSNPMTAEGVDYVNYEYIGLYKPGVGLFPWSQGTVIGDKAYVQNYEGTVFTEFIIPTEITRETKLKKRGVGLNVARDRALITAGSWYAAYPVANVLVHDGLVYSVATGGPLRVFDAETLEAVYSVRLDMNTIMFAYPYPHGSGVCASPALGGKHIYIFGNGGHTMVIKPGRTFEVVAENRIERLMPGHYQGGVSLPSDQGFYPECTVSSPIFDGDRIYYQGEGYLYCIGKKQ
ncbi:MAG TPA: hypothetical protein VMZ92_00035, partial [Planctomycetota bacterium]|nr:hypothetical protein [Planctomycetota bacterium]